MEVSKKWKKKRRNTMFATLNVRGCNSEDKLETLATDAMKYNVDILTVSETHIPSEEELYEIEVQDEKGKRKTYLLYSVSKEDDSHHGTGILINKNLNPKFRKINDRICTATFKHKSINVTVIALYAPTSPNCDKDPNIREHFYEQLNTVIEKVPKRNFLVIAGDFNAKIGSAHNTYTNNMGKYGKGYMNESGRTLLELCIKHDLVVTNTLFQHKLSHRTTWCAPERKFITHDGTVRRNPIRNQIDFVIVRNTHRHLVIDARSYGGTDTDTDHKMVISKIDINLHKMYKKKEFIPKINIPFFANTEKQEEYKKRINEQHIENQLNAAEKWKEITNICTTVGKEVLGTRSKKEKYQDEELKRLSNKSSKLRKDIESCQDMESRKEIKEKRKEVKKEIKQKMKKCEEDELDKDLEDLERMKNDSNKYHLAMKKLRNRKKKEPLLVKDKDGNLAGSDEDKAKLIAEYFKEMLAPPGAETNKSYEPCEMSIPFNEEEVEKAAKSLKNGKSPGTDNVHAEHIKYAPTIIHKNIADILNKTAATGEGPEELETGILAPLPKPNKTKGPRENLRPIMLLSIIRKILTICLIKRTWDRISTKIGADQAAYQSGRSTTEQVFAIKILTEKAITSSDYKLYLLLLDMSKAFDTVDRKKLFEILEEILLPEELHLFNILTRKPKIKVKVNEVFSETFHTLIGILQGDCVSAILFILYLACCLQNEKEYMKTAKIVINPKFADDITYLTNDKDTINCLKENIPQLLQKFNLQVNHTKTEYYEIPKPPPPRPPPPTLQELIKHKDDKPLWSDLDWLINYNPPPPKDKTPDYKKCKLLGSLLDTTADINRRKSLTIDAMRKLSYIFHSNRISIKLKIRIFQGYISSIFLYNSELWTMNKNNETLIDSFHRRQLRYAMGYKWPKIINSIDLYNITKVEPWSKVIKRRRLNWLGHLMRLDEGTPAKRALKEALRPEKRPVGRPALTWLDIVKKDLSDKNININLKNQEQTLQTLKDITSDRKTWKITVKNLCSENCDKY